MQIKEASPQIDAIIVGSEAGGDIAKWDTKGNLIS